MNSSAISVEDLAKVYRIGRNLPRYRTLREHLTRTATLPIRRVAAVFRGESAREDTEALWALDGLSFEIDQQDVVGIVGPNGAGKTTLLKILSRITDPSRGSAVIRGRVGSLLEVGTGFHAELTGRENIFLNGAILGMTRAEVRAKLDRIVQFAELARFIDTPVKFYSSGMYVRLAFSVAAHLEPDILLIDEVLAVGDLAFQRKCFSRLRDMTEQGKTIIVVSHNLYAIQTFCKNVIWLKDGKLREMGPTAEVLSRYQLEMSETGIEGKERDDRDSPEAAITEILVNGHPSRYVTLRETRDLEIEFGFEVRDPIEVSLGVSLSTADRTYLTGLATGLEGSTYQLAPGQYRAGVRFPGLVLSSGVYVVRISLMSADGAHSFSYRSPAATLYVESPFSFDGILSPLHQWIEPTSHSDPS